jgi:hypothetical protein
MFQLLVTKAADKFQGIPSPCAVAAVQCGNNRRHGQGRHRTAGTSQPSLPRHTDSVATLADRDGNAEGGRSGCPKGQRNDHASRIQRRGHADLVHQGGEQNGGQWSVSEQLSELLERVLMSQCQKRVRVWLCLRCTER